MRVSHHFLAATQEVRTVHVRGHECEERQKQYQHLGLLHTHHLFLSLLFREGSLSVVVCNNTNLCTVYIYIYIHTRAYQIQSSLNPAIIELLFPKHSLSLNLHWTGYVSFHLQNFIFYIFVGFLGNRTEVIC